MLATTGMRQRDKDRVLQWWYVGRDRYEKLRLEITRLFDHELDPRVPADSIYTIRARLKGELRLVEKVDLHSGGGTPAIDQIPAVVEDLLGIRIICLRLSDVDRVEAFIEALEKEGKLEFVKAPERKQTFILPMNPGEAIPQDLDLQYTGYSSIHYQVRLGPASQPAQVLKGLEAEIQVRTILEEAWGEIDHKYRYELSRAGVSIADEVKLGFYSFSAYLQAAALHAEYLARSTETLAPPAPTPPPSSIAKAAAAYQAVRSDLAHLVGFTPSDQTLNYLVRRTAEHGVSLVPLSTWLPERIVAQFASTYQGLFGVRPFTIESEREVDLVNLANFGLLANSRGERLAKNGLVSVLRRRQKATETPPRDFVLRKPATGDDDYWGQTIDFVETRRLTLTVTPMSPTDYWRLGLKFSQDGRFDEQRYGGGMALFHLAKPAAIPELHWVYYTPSGTSEGERPLLLGYSQNAVTIVCTAGNDELQIEAFNQAGVLQLRNTYPLPTHRYAKVFAWGDGDDYALSIEALIAI